MWYYTLMKIQTQYTYEKIWTTTSESDILKIIDNSEISVLCIDKRFGITSKIAILVRDELNEKEAHECKGVLTYLQNENKINGGIVVTNDDKLFEQVVLLREYGWQTRYVSKIRGTNSRLDEIQAAILRVKLRYLYDENERRRMIAKVYTKGLSGSGLTLPKLIRGTVPVFHQYVIRTKERNALQAKLKEQGIGTAIHYPVPIHKQEAYCDRVFSPLPLIHTEKVVSQILSLPMYPELTDREVERVIRAILMFTNN